jgi:hypothetical protein
MHCILNIIFQIFFIIIKLLYIFSLTCPTGESHIGSDLVNEKATTPCLSFSHHKPLKRQYRYVCSVCYFIFVLEKGMCFFIFRQVFRKCCQTVCNVWCEIMVSKEMDPIIVMTLIAHSTPTLISCNGTSWLTWDFLETSTNYSENSHLC